MKTFSYLRLNTWEKDAFRVARVSFLELRYTMLSEAIVRHCGTGELREQLIKLKESVDKKVFRKIYINDNKFVERPIYIGVATGRPIPDWPGYGPEFIFLFKVIL